jgi:hypothetical protein
MDEREIAERLQHFQKIASKHGYQTVPAATVYQAFDELAQPGRLGFVTIRTGLYGRVVNDDLVHLMKLQALKGASYSVWWGVSLSYVPHEWRTGLRWHRSLRSSRFDLFEIPGASAADWRETEKDIAHTQYGKTYFAETLHTMWARLRPQVTAWLSSVQSIAGVLSKAHEQAERKWTGPLHHPNPLLVYALTLGRMGRMEEAMAALSRYLSLGLESPEAQANLKNALERGQLLRPHTGL